MTYCLTAIVVFCSVGSQMVIATRCVHRSWQSRPCIPVEKHSSASVQTVQGSPSHAERTTSIKPHVVMSLWWHDFFIIIANPALTNKFSPSLMNHKGFRHSTTTHIGRKLQHWDVRANYQYSGPRCDSPHAWG